MEYNVENLFDCRDDEGKDDEEFLPEGERRWTYKRYWCKLADISKVVATMSDDRLPDIIGLCEVENDTTMFDLCNRSPMRTLGYEYVMTDSRDKRGIDVALLWRPSTFRKTAHCSIRVPSDRIGLAPTRDILYVKGKATGMTDTLHIFVVHLPSKLGGTSGRRHRELAARTLWNVVDSVQTLSNAKVVVMGDFNATERERLFNGCHLTRLKPSTGRGSYCYQGRWECIDHILVSRSMKGKARVLALPWLLENNKKEIGDHPRRTYAGPVYKGGVSDHLPLIADFTFK